MAEVVGYAKNAGLNAIINIHHDGFRQSKDELQPYTWLDIQNAATAPAVNERVKAQLAAMWTLIAERFKSEGDYLMFESMNEVQDGGWGWGDNLYDGGRQYAVLNEWNQLFVDAVRATGGNNATRYLGVPGYSTNIDLTVGNFELPTDVAENKLLVSVHFYEPNDYSLNAIYSEWGHTASPSNKAPNGDEDNVRAQLNKVKTTFINNNIPVYVGEFGCVHRADPREEAFRLYYLEYVCKAAKDYGMAAFYWDNGDAGAGAEKSGLFDRATGDLLNNAQEVIDVMKRGYFTDDASYTLQSVFENAPQ